MKMAFRRLPKTTQNRPKRLPRTSFFRPRFRPRFRIDFGRILAPKMPPFGHPFRCQNRSKKLSKFNLQKRWAQERPKTPPRGSQDGPGRPQERPRPSQDAPRSAFWPPWAPKLAQVRPKTALGTPSFQKTRFFTKYKENQ